MNKSAQIANHFRYLFIPHSHNNHRAKLLHPQSLMLAIITVLLFNFSTNQLSRKYKILGFAANISPQKVIELTNSKRAEAGLGTLTENSILDKAAAEKGAHMLANNYWAHVAPDGTEPWYFFAEQGYSYKYAGENLARDFSDPNSAVEAWMASPSHRENLLSPKYKDVGVAVVEGDLNGVDTTIIVQFFGTSSVDTTPVIPVASADKENTLVPEVKAQEPEPVSPVLTETIAGANIQKAEMSPFWLSKNTSLILISIFLIVFILDSAVVAYRGVSRIGGRQFIHISFLGMVLIVLVISQSGKIF